jgi:hypothetical protein
MKTKQLKRIPDGETFKLSTKKGSAVYAMNRKDRYRLNGITTMCTYTSIKSGRTFKKEGALLVYPWPL